MRQPGSRLGFALALAGVHVVAACAAPTEVDFADRSTPEYPGLYTPGSQIGAIAAATSGAKPDAGSGPSEDEQNKAIEEGINEVLGQDRCVGYTGAGAMGGATADQTAMTRGTLSIEFETAPLGQHKTYSPTNVGAVWIEDAAEVHIKTLDVWADERIPALFVWRKRGCARLEVDAISGPTRMTHDGKRMAAWQGDDLHGNQVPDGTYRLNIEVTETEGDYSKWSVIEFQKGPQPFVLMPPDHPAHQKLRVSYTPMQ